MTPSLLDCVLMEEDSSAPKILLKVLNNIKHTKTLDCLTTITGDNDSESGDNVTEERNKARENAEDEIETEYGQMIRFLWAVIHEPQLVNKIPTRTCVKPST